MTTLCLKSLDQLALREYSIKKEMNKKYIKGLKNISFIFLCKKLA